MCVGQLATLVELHDDDGVRVGRLDDGCLVPLAFVPQARPGDALLLHLGIPVEVLDRDVAREALCLRASAAAALGDARTGPADPQEVSDHE